MIVKLKEIAGVRANANTGILIGSSLRLYRLPICLAVIENHQSDEQ